MSELAPKSPNNETLRPVESAREQLDEIRKELENKAEKSPDQKPDTTELAKRAEQYAISGKEFSRSEQADTRHHPVLVNKQLKDIAYSRTMTRVRKNLSAPSRVLSKAVHSRVLDKPSELASKTVARPSSMLGGAFFAAVGTSALLWITKHYGYEYNYLFVVFLFAGGMIAGLLIEVALKSLKKR